MAELDGRAPPTEYDIAIVGGGPAGTSTALHLARNEGIRADRIVILDKAKFPRDKPCAGAVSQLGLEVLRAIGIEVTVPFVAMTGVRVLFRDDAGEIVSPLGVCIRRTEFDAQLLTTAKADGVRVIEGDGVRAIARAARDGFVLTTAGGQEITTRFVAACDGAGSTMRKLLRIREPDRKGHLYVLDTETRPSDIAVKRGLVDFDLSVLDEGLAGYYWDFPTLLDGVPSVSRGIYDANVSPEGQAKTKEVLARALEQRGIEIAKVKLRPFSTRPFGPRSTLWVHGVVLVGEACGIDQTTGEGIAQAIDMGRMAARHLASACRSGDRCFEAYERAVRGSTTGRHMLQSAWLARRVYARRGRPALRYLLDSGYARSAAVKWYRGETLPASTLLWLGLGLAATGVTRRP